MPRSRLAAAALPALLALPLPALAEAGAEGLWRTEANDAGGYLEVRIAPCADAPDRLCGVIERALRPEGPNPDYAHLGRRILRGMAPAGPGAWDDGEIWAPDEDESYAASLQLSGDVLTVEGCLLVFCREQDWRRVE